MTTTHDGDDLARQRRIRRLVREVADRLREAPRVRSRVVDLAAGAVRAGRLMMQDRAVSFRFPTVLMEEIERLSEKLEEVPAFRADGQVTPSRVVRLALSEGLHVLHTYGIGEGELYAVVQRVIPALVSTVYRLATHAGGDGALVLADALAYAGERLSLAVTVVTMLKAGVAPESIRKRLKVPYQAAIIFDGPTTATRKPRRSATKGGTR